MAWIKKGRIFSPNGEHDWMQHSVLTPTPFLLDDDTIRIYAAFRDGKGKGRIGYVDLEARDPSIIRTISQAPVIELGRPGAFDDNGMLLGDVIRHQGQILMYYVGFQLVQQVKFLAFTGLAISADGGETFHRHSEAPILDRTANGLFIQAIHTVLVDNGVFHVWYATGTGWRTIDGIDYPEYHIRYTQSPDGIHFPDREGLTCLTPAPNEYRIGRPRVRRVGLGYEMRFTFDTLDKQYMTRRAFSPDGISWTRDDEDDIPRSLEGWDSREVSYPCVLETRYGTYMFYDGNGMGREGFGYAELTP